MDLKTQLNVLDVSDRIVKRVISPYVKLQWKKPSKEPLEITSDLISRPEIAYMFRDMRTYLSDFIDLPIIMHQSSDAIKAITKSVRVSLYMVDEALNEIYLIPKHIKNDRHEINWKIQPGSSVSAYCAYQKEYLMLEDIQNDDRCPQGIGYRDDTIKSVLCVPIMTPEGNCLGVVELCRDILSEPYSVNDLKIAVLVTGWMGTAIHQNNERVAVDNEKKINECLLELVKCFFTTDLPLVKMISEIMKLTKTSIKAQRGSFYVIDQDSDDMLADVFEEGIDGGTMYKKNVPVKLRKDRGILGTVARQGITVKLNNVGKGTPFHKDIDNTSDYITKSIMSTPIMSGDSILGIIQVINKCKPYERFSKNDEEVFKVISLYCGLALQYNKLRSNLIRNDYFNECYMDLLQKHMKPCEHEPPLVPSIRLPADFDKFTWVISQDLIESLPSLCVHIFAKCLGAEHIDYLKLVRFVQTVKKMYRNQPFHNFEHAFMVTHTMYNILMRNNNLFSLIEKYSLLVAAFCHDIDHQGYTNNYLTLTKNNLALLYNESIIESHNVNVTRLILNDLQFLKNVSKEDYAYIIEEIKDNILATDFTVHFKMRNKLHQILFDWHNTEHRSYLKMLIMTACDISVNTKSFVTAKSVLLKLYREFYGQGDKERNLGFYPLSMLDREKENLMPEDQVQFHNVFCLPCYKLLAYYLPNTERMYKEAKKLRESWLEIIEMKGSKHWRQFESIVGTESLSNI